MLHILNALVDVCKSESSTLGALSTKTYYLHTFAGPVRMIFWGRLGGCVRLVKRDRSLFAFCMKRALTGRHLSQN